MTAPLILTLQLAAEAQAFFDALRRAHFPPARNYLAAHLTLFHHLPGACLADVAIRLSALSAAQAPLPLRVAGLQFLGQGVAYAIDSPPLEALHRQLQQEWWTELRPQDQQRCRPHVTVQNKVAPAVARALHQQLSAGFAPFDTTGTGLQLWAYRGGPWELLRTFPFAALQPGGSGAV
ncbi:2'-5' RNA ligase family protein [Hymenobacter sp. B81]|uniref:2'-5' RNA ligase family protein n=1 Tax=Hymenobacter sp. B81 TaxID=3344878 RepID=UPI0037DC43DC